MPLHADSARTQACLQAARLQGTTRERGLTRGLLRWGAPPRVRPPCRRTCRRKATPCRAAGRRSPLPARRLPATRRLTPRLIRRRWPTTRRRRSSCMRRARRRRRSSTRPGRGRAQTLQGLITTLQGPARTTCPSRRRVRRQRRCRARLHWRRRPWRPLRCARHGPFTARAAGGTTRVSQPYPNRYILAWSTYACADACADGKQHCSLDLAPVIVIMWLCANLNPGNHKQTRRRSAAAAAHRLHPITMVSSRQDTCLRSQLIGWWRTAGGRGSPARGRGYQGGRGGRG